MNSIKKILAIVAALTVLAISVFTVTAAPDSFNIPNTMSVAGNENDGYTLSGAQNTIGTFKKSLNLITQSIQFKTVITGDWDFLAFTNSDTPLSGVFIGDDV